MTEVPPITGVDQVAVVTGGAGGIGSAIAKHLSSMGMSVAVFDIASAEETRSAIVDRGGTCEAYQLDIIDESAVHEALDDLRSTIGPVSILINNAGVSQTMPLTDLTFDGWRRVLSTNLDAPFLLAKAVASDMIDQRWGRIVNVSSSSIYMNLTGRVAYMASKAGLLGLTSGLANDLGGYGITVNAVAPGLTRTAMVDRQLAEARYADSLLQQLAEQRVVSAPADVNDVCGVIALLVSDQAASLTAQFIVADGGMTRHL